MKEHFAPSLSQKIDSYYLLWFKNSNQYVVLDETLYSLIQHFFLAKDFKSFEATLLKLNFEPDHIKNIFKDIDLFVESCNQQKQTQELPLLDLHRSYRNISKHYKIGELIIEVHFDSEKLKQLIHPQLSHLITNKKNVHVDHVFDIYIENDDICLFQDATAVAIYPKSDYHLLQGKFVMQLLCAITNTTEKDWLGTFHASSVHNNEKAVMLIGDSGSGKSTFTALLTANGFNLLADDITPIRANSKKLFGYPAAISIKSGAFEMFNSLIPEFNKLKEVYINPYKGYVKYLPVDNTKYLEIGYDCNTLVCINYDKDQKKSLLEDFDISKALNILIPESWIEPSEQNAKQFLNWLQKLNCYKLTYSNNEEAINKFSELF